ncbi:EF-hand domain-containing protein [Ovoidimarina sediminis]|uniref:EF-hand domain-containing protein n=1 Tax=Ovoidimarina sediminis TaxID=3079856 RepID=UPI002915B678|nr:EF-hand domain-containing protein [Rhodophyticola sp. MJ-SS7]MDU8942129.1 EF-hand domain-containing protein [Rhodophyticola sp. MJ-SS7]
MKKTLIIVGLVAGIALAGSATLARDHGPGDMRAKFDELDFNGDGTVTRMEMETARESRFSDADKDSDGMLTEAEFVAAAVDRARQMAAQAFQRFDADGDGFLSQDAIAAHDGRGRGLDRMFSRVDANGDDQVTAEEFEAALAHFAQARGLRGHGKERR